MEIHEKEIIYSLILCKQVPVAEYATHAGTFKRYVNGLIPQIQHSKKQASYLIEGFNFHVLISDNRSSWYLCITPDDFDEELAFSFLNELCIQFEAEFKDQIAFFNKGLMLPLRYEFNQAFSAFMMHSMRRYNKTVASGMDTITIKSPSLDPSKNTVSHFVPPIDTLRRRVRIPLLIQSTKMIVSQGVVRKVQNENALSRWLGRHPYFMIGFCIFLGLFLLLYFVVVVPLCGYDFGRVDEDKKYVCWFSAK